jgi:hypothetical protein
MAEGIAEAVGPLAGSTPTPDSIPSWQDEPMSPTRLGRRYPLPISRRSLLLAPPAPTGNPIEDTLSDTLFSIRLYQTFYMRSARGLDYLVSGANAAVILLGASSSITSALSTEPKHSWAHATAIIIPAVISVIATLAITFRLRDKFIERSYAVSKTIDLITEFRNRRRTVQDLAGARELRDKIRARLMDLDKKQWLTFAEFETQPQPADDNGRGNEPI